MNNDDLIKINDKINRLEVVTKCHDLEKKHLDKKMESTDNLISQISNKVHDLKIIVDEHSRDIEKSKRLTRFLTQNWFRLPAIGVILFAIMSFSNWLYDLQTITKDLDNKSLSDYLMLKNSK